MPNPIVVSRQVADSDQPGAKVRHYHYYWCPGCDALHGITINPSKNTRGAGWDFTGTLECPTYHPSQLTTYELTAPKPGKYVCHTFIRKGMIEFLKDCTHKLRGQTVPMVPVPDFMVKEGDRKEAR